MTTIVAGLDIESTGLDFRANHKIIEIAITRYELETQKHIDSLAMRFNPRRSIDPKAQAVHGISLEDLSAEPLLSEHAGKIARYISDASVLVAHNGEAFDLPFIRHEFAEYGVTLPELLLWTLCYPDYGRQKTANGRDWRNSPSHWVLSMTRLRRTARSMIPI